MKHITIDELIERLDVETDCLGASLREAMKGDISPGEHIPGEHIHVEDELIEGGDEEWQREWTDDNTFKEDVFVVKSFIVWTRDFIYHSESDEHAYLYEDGRIYRVRQHPIVTTGATLNA